MHTRRKLAVTTCLIAIAAASLWAQDPPAKPAQPPAPPAQKPDEDWHTVAKGAIKVEVELEGTFAATHATPVEVKTKAFGGQGLKVVVPVTQGTAVKKGDVLVKFSTEEIDKAIRDAEMTEAAVKLALDTAEKESAWAREEAELDRKAAEMAVTRRTHDDKRYEEVEKPLTRKNYISMLDRNRDMLEGQMEELKQLEKMYREDDLTEETEEIILKRQKRSVEYATLSVEQAEASFEENMNIKLARTDEDRAIGRAKADIAHQRGLNQIGSRLLGVSQGLTRAHIAHEEAAKKLAELRADREPLTVTSPADGVVYFGRVEKGKWQDVAMVESNMKEDGSLRPNVAFLTVVGPGPLFVYSTANEGNVLKLRAGQPSLVIAGADPFSPIQGKVRSVAQFPIGNHEVLVDLDEQAHQTTLRPGMSCKVKVTTYEKADAVKVPLSAVKSDEPGVYHVFVQTADGGSEKRVVKVGQRTAQEAEVLEGLAEGDKVKKNG